ncbi:hypothetical protein Cgig2_026272 [Carnegiea gigantea]|uniref:Uncharacterized protein n=1 Tax=Carnegiea gigantea TaxID=171969 RepID=A0A9Q1JQJ5_9CARY|nr:hypothetical protein Cgig2_026272 [Carnegiea gigantea]
MTDTILQQVTKHVKKTMEAANSMRSLPTFNYVHTAVCKPSRRHAPAKSLRRNDKEHTDRSEWTPHAEEAAAHDREHLSGGGLLEQQPLEKKQRTKLPPSTENMTICTLTSTNPGQLRLEPVDSLEVVSLKNGRPDSTVKLSQEMEDETKHTLVSLLQE